MTQKNHTDISHLIKPKPTTPSFGKEAEPVTQKSEEIEVQEVVEHEINDKELEKHVDVLPESIKLPPDLKKLGIQTDTNPKFPDYKNIKLPISDEKVITGLNEPVTSSWRWLAEFAKYLLKQAHLTLKRIHGKVVRVRAR